MSVREHQVIEVVRDFRVDSPARQITQPQIPIGVDLRALDPWRQSAALPVYVASRSNAELKSTSRSDCRTAA